MIYPYQSGRKNKNRTIRVCGKQQPIQVCELRILEKERKENDHGISDTEQNNFDDGRWYVYVLSRMHVF